MKEKRSREKLNTSLLVLAICLLLLLPAAVLVPQIDLAARYFRAHMEEGPTESDVIVQDEELAQVELFAPNSFVTVEDKTFYLDENSYAVTGLQLIDGKYRYFDRNGVMAKSLGVDVSTYNESIDWDAAREQGIDFAIVRVGGRGWTSGKIYGDLRANEYLHKAKTAGLKLGVYFYSTAVNAAEAAAEADEVLRCIGGIPLDLPVFIDVEQSGEFPEGRADKIDPAGRADIVDAFCRRIESAGYRPGVYSGQYFFKYSLAFAPLRRYTIWLASYTSDGLPPHFHEEYAIWQFTDAGNVRGIRCPADLNVILS